MVDSPELSIRIQKLLDQRDFLTQERLKLVAKQKSQKDNIQSFMVLLHPTLLMAQTVGLEWLSLGDNLESNITTSLDKQMKEYFEHPVQIFLNYIGILKLKWDILKNPNSIQQREQLDQFNEKLTYLKKEKQQLRKLIGEEYYFQYDLAIDSVFFPYQKRLQEFVKIIDAFQMKLTNLHALIPSELQTAWNSASEQIQNLEDEIETIRKTLHNSGEMLIYQLIDGFILILSHIVTKIEQNNLLNLNLEEYIQEEYRELQDVRDEFLYKIDQEIYSCLYELLSPLHAKATDFVTFFQTLFDKFHNVNPIVDPQIEIDIDAIDQKIHEITEKIGTLQKNLS